MTYFNIAKIYDLCKLSYKEPNQIDNNKFIFIENKETDAQCYLFIDEENKILYITFRGTSSNKDISIDIKINKTDFLYDTKVHKGFFEQYMSIKTDLISSLNDYKNEYNS